MAYATTSENLISSLFDELNALQVIKECEKTLEYTKRFPSEKVSDNFKLKIYSLNASLETLIDSWRLSGNARKNVLPKIDEKLWENKIGLKFLFQEYIEERAGQLGNDTEKSLYCRLCKMNFPSSTDYLLDHLTGMGHIFCFEKAMKDEESVWDNLWEDHLQKCQYGKFFEYNGPNNNLFCKVCCVEIPRNTVNLKGHVEGRPHVKKFEELISFLIGDGSKKVVDEKQLRDKEVTAFMRNEFIPDTKEACSLPVDRNLNNLSSFKLPSLIPEQLPTTEFFHHKALTAISLEVMETEEYNSLFCCCFCSYYSCTPFSVNEHVNSREHVLKISTARDVQKKICSCNLLIICDSKTLNFHLTSDEHQSLMKILDRLRNRPQYVRGRSEQNKSSSSCSIASNISNNLSRLEAGDSFESDADNTECLSDVTSECGSEYSSVSMGASKLPKSRVRQKNRYMKKHYSTNQSQSAQRAKQFAQGVTKLGLADLPEGTSKEEIIKATQHFGEVTYVNIMNNEKSANVSIKLRDEYTNIVDLRIYVVIKKQKVFIGNPIFNEKFDLPESVKLQYMSGESLLNLMIFLTRKSEDNDNFVDLHGLVDSKIETIKRNVEDVFLEADNVIAVGSRPLHLATNEDAILDLFVSVGDNYRGNKSQDILLLSARTVAIECALCDRPALFSNSEVIGDVEQVVHFKHNLTGLNCRIFCRNGLVVEKTKLIKTYLEYDGRVKKVLLYVRDWAKETGLTEVISQYAVTWLVLFTLMQGPEHKLLPPVNDLRNRSQEEEREFIAGWDCRFCKNPSALPSPNCSKTAIDLLKYFFKMNSNILFIKHVFAPLTGQYLLKKDVGCFNLPPPYRNYKHLQMNSGAEKDRFKITKGLCLMDPLELNRNLTEALEGPPLTKFGWMCKKTLALMNNFT